MGFSRRFEAALVYATQLHDGHVRKGTEVPYVTHLLAVASLVAEAGGSEDEVIAALLHDAIEDRGGRPVEKQIRELFGDAVGDIVRGCSDTDKTPKPPWKERKEAYVTGVGNKSESVLLVSCADKLHNARAIVADYREIGDALWERFNATQQETLWYYGALVDKFRERGVPARLLDELERTVRTMEELVGKPR